MYLDKLFTVDNMSEFSRIDYNDMLQLRVNDFCDHIQNESKYYFPLGSLFDQIDDPVAFLALLVDNIHKISNFKGSGYLISLARFVCKKGHLLDQNNRNRFNGLSTSFAISLIGRCNDIVIKLKCYNCDNVRTCFYCMNNVLQFWWTEHDVVQ